LNGDLHDNAERAFSAARRQTATWDEGTQMLAHALLERQAEPPRVAARIRGASAPFNAIRIHGDFHLGQTLKTHDGFVIIDFEGEPARPLAERRRKHAALKDAAGMLRSFDYAVETALPGDANVRTRGRLLGGMRQAFLDRYLETAASAGTTAIPVDRTAIDRWLTFFEFEKALYELLYEINNRPDWVPIPLRALLRALGVAPGRAASAH
jgi:maltose alpha-D-glucosyltransferase/alpha-amylase